LAAIPSSGPRRTEPIPAPPQFDPAGARHRPRSPAPGFFRPCSSFTREDGPQLGRAMRLVDAYRGRRHGKENGGTWNFAARIWQAEAEMHTQWNGGSFLTRRHCPRAPYPGTSLAGSLSTSTAYVAGLRLRTRTTAGCSEQTRRKVVGVDYDSRQGTGGEEPRLVGIVQTVCE